MRSKTIRRRNPPKYLGPQRVTTPTQTDLFGDILVVIYIVIILSSIAISIYYIIVKESNEDDTSDTKDDNNKIDFYLS